MSASRPALTPEQARAFDRYSVANAAIVASALPCGCEPYVDVFTFARWRAQGRVVKKGEKAVRIATYAPVTKRDENGEETVVGKRPWRSAVFCRCQTTELAAFLRAPAVAS